jgi:hypothetical protein
MLRLSKLLPVVAVAMTGAVLLLVPGKASADFKVRITTLSGSATITDGGAGDLDGLVNNSITVNYNDASYNVIGTISFTNTPGTATLGLLDVSYNISTRNLTGGANGTGGLATLEASATGYTQPTVNPLTLSNTFNGNGSGTGSITSQAYADPANGLFSEGGGFPSPGPVGPFPIGQSGGFNGAGSVLFNKGGTPYSLTDVLTFNLNPNSNVSGDSQDEVTPYPAPASLLLIASGVPFMGLGAWLRRRRSANSAAN